ncbi:MAG: hypothetical protein AB7C91_01465 [Sphaerochaeta sp.]|uniref:hypothetical protein n=1 Tax=Sphaerochaeta sp. TaxID=1972642 RepID=UPI003D0FA924
MKKRIILISIALIIFLSGCDSVLQFFTGSNDEEQKSYIYQSDDKSVTVVSANPKPADINKDGFTFNVSLNLPYNANGYYVWIIPEDFYSPDVLPGEVDACWYLPSRRYSATSNDVIGGGWLSSYNSSTRKFTHIRVGIIYTWNIIVAKVNTDLTQTDIFDSVFKYRVEEI